MFSTLDPSTESRKLRSVAFTYSLFIQLFLVGGVILVGILFPAEVPLIHKQYFVTWLPELLPPAQPVVKPPLIKVQPVLPKLTRLVAPAAPPAEAKLVIPKIAVSPPPLKLPAPPPPASPPAPVAQLQTPPKVQPVVHTGTFLAAAEPVTAKRPTEKVQTGGFGSPEGLPGRASDESARNVPKLGSFGLPVGPGVGNGTGGYHGIQGVVTTVGFGAGLAGVGTGRGTPAPPITTGGFEKMNLAASLPAKSLPVPPPSDIQPVEIISKPTPVYTEEARQLRIQGEVVLSVVFQASGGVRVLEVVKFLGHGLDQAAQQAATQIRFKPAHRDGKPMDFPATVRIQFRLADQST
jgi:TonB family protein